MSNLQQFYQDIAVPDLVIPGDGVPTNPLDPCPLCNSRPEDAPEGVHSIHSGKKNHAEPGSAVWNYAHCWKCGFRPGTNVAVNENELRRQFEAFKSFMADKYDEMKNARGIAPPANDEEVADLKRQLAEAQAQIAAETEHGA